MVCREITVTNPTGLHCRPLGKLVQAAKGFQSNVRIRKGDKSFDAKNMINMLQSGICQGEQIIVETNGADEQLASDELIALIESFVE